MTKMANWKAPGPDMICTFWIKALPRMASHLKELLLGALNGDQELPQWFVTGRMVLIPKEGCTGQQDQFRPITC